MPLYHCESSIVFYGIIHVVTGIEEAEFLGKGHFAEDIESKVVQPVTKVKFPIFGCESVDLFHEQFFGVVYEARELLHGAHTVRSGGNAFLLSMNSFSCLCEYIGVLWRRKDAVEVCLPKPFTDGENVFRRSGR